jgi:lysophospholipase L1-like esterase
VDDLRTFCTIGLSARVWSLTLPRMTKPKALAAAALLGLVAWAGLVGCGSGSGSGGITVGSCPGTRWVASWIASPAGTDGSVFVNQTLRFVVNPHFSGHSARVHLSNRFGRRPLRLSSVTVADRAGGASVDASTLRPVTFGGHRSVTIAPGADAVSDSVSHAVRAFKDIVISLAVRGASGTATTHFDANQTSYLSRPGSGDHTREASAAAFSLTTASWYFLSGIDVRASRDTGALVAFGDSVTDGTASGLDANSRYPDQLAKDLSEQRSRISVLNAGIAGNRLIGDGAAAPAAITRVQKDLIAIPGVTDALVAIGGNDLLAPPFHTPAAVEAALRRLVARLKAAHLHVIVGTIVPLATATTHDANRQTVNRWIRSRAIGDAVVDFDSVVRASPGASTDKPGFAGADGIHPDAAGYGAMAAAVPASLPTGRGCGAG